MAVGFSPKHIDNLKTIELSKNQSLILAIETAKKLGWNIGFLTESGFKAYTKFSMSSWSEQVQVTVEDKNINLKSECTGNQIIDWGKNKKNTDLFILTFNSLISTFTIAEFNVKYGELAKDFTADINDIEGKSPLSQKEKTSTFLSVFMPTQGYFISPILININIGIFIIMAITGVNIMEPSSESLLLWGANFRPETLDGEWWRLFSSCFLHIGILHLLMNMYALMYIGILLEPYLGKSRFISAYLLTGIAGSTASLYWNELTISAGASGAIFGMYGVFLAMLTTNLIDKSARQSLLLSIGVFVGYNLLNGLQGGIDNAAHVGGLVSGLIIGYSFYPSLTKPSSPALKSKTIGLLSLLILTSVVFVLSTTAPSDINEYDEEMKRFSVLEKEALSVYEISETATDSEFLDAVQYTGIPNWESSIELLDNIATFELPNSIHDRNLKLKEYCNLRLESYKLIYNAFNESTDKYDSEIEECNKKIELILTRLNEE